MEIELKLALNPPDALDALLNALPQPTAVLRQTNHYFTDPAGRLAKDRIMVRVRENEHEGEPSRTTVILTIKCRASVEGGVFTAREDEVSLMADDWFAVRDAGRPLLDIGGARLRAVCTQRAITDLVEVGLFHNTRHCIPFHGFNLEVDRTLFPNGRVDAEIEVETEAHDRARELLQAFAARYGFDLTPQTLGKYSRFLSIIQSSPR